MAPRKARWAVCAFAVACAGVWWNLMYMQRGTGYSASFAQALPEAQEGRREARSPQRERDSQPEAASPASSDLIRAVQRELAQRGYNPGPQDGTVNPVTRAAILAYEKDQGLPPSGEPSERLLKAMIFSAPEQIALAPAARSAPAAGDATEAVRSVQVALARLGYAVGRADGRLGEDTARAIRKFEVEHGLPATGRISAPLLSKLAEATAGKAPPAAR